MTPTNQFSSYPTRYVGPGGSDVPGGNEGVYASIQYGLNDWLVQRQRRLVVRTGMIHQLGSKAFTTFPLDNKTVTTGYRVLEGDVTGVRPDVDLNCWGFYPANKVPTTGWAIRWLSLHGLGNIANVNLPNGNITQAAPIHIGYSTDFLVEGNDVDGVFNTNPSGNQGFLGYNMGNGDYAYEGVWNQNRMTNCGCNKSALVDDTGRNAMVYVWGGHDFKITNNTADCWGHFFYMKGAQVATNSVPQDIECYGNKVTRNVESDAAPSAAFLFGPLSAPVACPNGIFWHHNEVSGFGTAFSATGYNESAAGPQGMDVEIYNNTCINNGSLYEIMNAINVKVYDNVHVPAKNADAMCGMTRPPYTGYVNQFSVFDRNAYYSGLGFSASAWQLDRYGHPQHNFGSFAAWQKAHTSTGTTELLSDPDLNGVEFSDLTAAFNNFVAGDYSPKVGGPLTTQGCYQPVSIGQTWE